MQSRHDSGQQAAAQAQAAMQVRVDKAKEATINMLQEGLTIAIERLQDLTIPTVPKLHA